MPTSTTHRATATAVLVMTVFAALIGSDQPGPRQAIIVSNVGQALAPALAALACLVASRRAPPGRLRRGWRLLAGSALSWSLGQVVWTYLEISRAAPPFPSLADVGFLLAVPLALAAVGHLVDPVARTNRLVSLVDGLLIIGGLLSVSWPLVLDPTWEAQGERTFSYALSLAYPIGTLAVASVVLVAVMRSGPRGPVPLGRLAAGLLVLASADSIFVWSTIHGTEQQISVADVSWTAGYALVLLAAISFPIGGTTAAQGVALIEAEEQALDGTPTSELLTSPPLMRRAALPLAMASLALVSRTVMVASGQSTDGFLDAVVVGTVALLLVRHLITIQENRELTGSLQQKIHELTSREEQLSHQALHDPLTSLANRRLFGDRVEHALSRSIRTGERTAVLFVDLDDFKLVNDSLGHAAGDRLLVAVAARLSGCVRPGDTVARLGGDEFGILLEEFGPLDRSPAVADRVLQALEVPFPVDGREVFTRASIGMAVTDREPVYSGEQLLADADAALYAAKAAGKATVRRFEHEMRSTAVARLELGQDLRRAIRHEQFLCHYQPIVELVSGRVVALEALVRWRHPERGLLNPADFIGLAEATGGINQIGGHVLNTATEQAATWREQGHIPRDLELHVNLSGRQLEEPDLVAQVRRELERSGFPPNLLVLEITESVAVDMGARHLERLEGLQALGVRLAIDDFGTGYSSLNYLRTLPVEVLKIDRAFAQSIDGTTDTVLLEAIVKLGHSLGIEVVAEGIERPEQVTTLRRLGCRRAQGYLFWEPIPADEIPALLAAGSLLPANDSEMATRPAALFPNPPV